MAHYIEKKDILFIHIPKTGGTSIGNFLGNYCKAKRVGEKHCSYQEWTQEYHTPKEYFTAVRNPYARLLSFYFYMGMRTKQRIGTQKWANIYDSEMLATFESGFSKSLSSSKFYGPVIMRNQVDYYDDTVKFVLRAETMNKEIIPIQRWLGCYEFFPKDNVGDQGVIDYKDYYDTTSRKFVEKHFEKDLDLLKYTF